MEAFNDFFASLNMYDYLEIAGMGLAGYEWQKVSGVGSIFTDAPLALGGMGLTALGVYFQTQQHSQKMLPLAFAVASFFIAKEISKID